MLKLSELKISPAPWELWNVSGAFNKLVNLRDNYEVAKAQDGTEVHFCSLLKDKAANLANARLIAAAPKLYEALLEMVEMYRDGGSYDYEQKVIAKAKSALAEAAGESEARHE